MSINSSQIVAALIGAALGAGALTVFISNSSEETAAPPKDEAQPLYWVAPMDANYRRDKPGKSPMGMDLIPVYESSSEGETDQVGTVKIDPQVINNLGVRTAKVSVKAMRSSISTVGYVQFDENQLVHIHPVSKAGSINYLSKRQAIQWKKDKPCTPCIPLNWSTHRRNS